VLEAYDRGAVVAGSSAGAMVMCEFYYDPYTKRVHEGLNIIPKSLVLPHHDTFGKGWAPQLTREMPDIGLLGIDEQTAMLDDGAGRVWGVYGAGSVTVYQNGGVLRYVRGESFVYQQRSSSA
jgi:cyanophycinase